MISQDALQVRPLAANDRDAWAVLWAAYLEFYETSVPASTYDLYFERLLGDDPRDLNGLVAVQGDALVGLTHFLFHRHGWKVEDTCYLQDLYATPQSRGTGVGRALIEAVYAAADTAGVSSVYWMTQENNTTARQLYDRIGEKTPFVQYRRTT